MQNLALIRSICAEVSGKADSEKVNELLQLLRALVRDDPEEIQSRLELLRRKYSIAFEEPARLPVPEAHE